MGTLAFFPSHQVMDRRMAEEKIGEMSLYGSDDKERVLKRLQGASVLIGWRVAEDGVTKSFLAGRARHIIMEVGSLTGRPVVTVFCSGDRLELFNWNTEECIAKPPAVLLSIKQAPYFRPCKKCMRALLKAKEGST